MHKPVLFIVTVFFMLTIGCSDKEIVAQTDVPEGYSLKWRDNFSSFNSSNWSRGLICDIDPSVAVIWNKQTGGSGLLNDNYCGYITDEDSYVENGSLYLRNQKRTYEGTSPAKTFNYTSGWVNSLRKVYINGTQKGIYLEIKAKFPTGHKVWPAIWLVTERRVWPPEIDVWEYFGKFFNTTKLDQMYMRYIYGPWNDTKNESYSLYNFHATYNAEAWHIYGFQWTDSRMIWTIDGTVVSTIKKETQILENWPNENMAFILNNGIMTVVPDQLTSWPNYLIIDYMAIYENESASRIIDVNYTK